MEELIRMVVQKTGVEQAVVQKVVHAAVEHVKGMLPPQFASQIDAMLPGGAGAGGQQPAGESGGLGGMLGGLLGGK